MALTIVETRAITGGVDTHADVHVAAALDPDRRAARRPGVPGHPGRLRPAAGLAGRVRDGVPGRDRGNRQLRRRPGPARHSGRRPGRGGGPLGPAGPPPAGQIRPLDAVSAARAAQSGRARGAPKGRDGAVEAIRALMVAKRSARSERTQTINQARALIVTGPDDLRARFARHTPAALVDRDGIAAAPPRQRQSATPPASRCGSWDGARSSSTASSAASMSSSSPW